MEYKDELNFILKPDFPRLNEKVVPQNSA